eukprot:376878_1
MRQNNNGYYPPQSQAISSHTPTHNTYSYNNATYGNNNSVTSPTNTTRNTITTIPTTNNINVKVQYLQRCDGTIISDPNATPTDDSNATSSDESNGSTTDE